MSSGFPAAVVSSGEPLVEGVLDALEVQALRIVPERLGRILADEEWSADGIVWIHAVPLGVDAGKGLAEAEFLLRSARGALATATAADVPLAFVALLPSRGLFGGEAGLACEVARGALEALMRTEVANWGRQRARILGVVYGGIEGHEPDGQRRLEDVKARTPVKRLGTAAQLADAIRYLGSARAGYVTGTMLHVDGGWNAYSWIYPARTI